jgi:galactokinase
MQDRDTRREQMVRMFESMYGTLPELWTRAPGRVDLMGSHTDYNLGYVMTMTIDRDTWVAAAPRVDRQVSIYSMNLQSGNTFSLDRLEHDAAVPWTNYVRGMAKSLQEAGHALQGFNAVLHSAVPFGSGLSSSAAIEMAVGAMFAAISGFTIDPVQMALLGQKAENQFVGVNCGILDQYSSALGKADSSVLLDCRDLTHRISPIAEGLQVMICDTRAERNLSGTEYDERRAQCEEGVRLLQAFYPDITALRDVSLLQLQAHEDVLPGVVARRCRFIIEENQRVLNLAGALAVGDRARLNALFAESFRGARDLYEISAPSMNHMMAAMLSAPGVVGARQAGAGFGGCMVALVEGDSVFAFVTHVEREYSAVTDIQPHVFPVRASDGAGRLYSDN